MDKDLKIIEGERLINARELHDALESKRDFSNWINDRIKKYCFEENEDFSTILLKSSGGRPKKEYILKLDVAKRIMYDRKQSKWQKNKKIFYRSRKKI